MTDDIEGWLRDSARLTKVIPINQVIRTRNGDVVVASAEIWPDEIVFRTASAVMATVTGPGNFILPTLTDDTETNYGIGGMTSSGGNGGMRAHSTLAFRPAPPDAATLVTLILDPDWPGLFVSLKA